MMQHRLQLPHFYNVGHDDTVVSPPSYSMGMVLKKCSDDPSKGLVDSGSIWVGTASGMSCLIWCAGQGYRWDYTVDACGPCYPTLVDTICMGLPTLGPDGSGWFQSCRFQPFISAVRCGQLLAWPCHTVIGVGQGASSVATMWSDRG